MATGMQVWSTTASSNANADTNVNFAEGMAPSQVNDSARAMMASAAKWVADNSGTLVTSGSSSAFTVATNQVEGALTDGYTVAVQFHTTPAAGATLAPDGLAAKPIATIANAGAGLGPSQVLGNSIQRLIYSVALGAWILQSYNPGVPVGAISPFAGSSSPGGWLLCDGTGYSQSTYAALFAVVSTTYGTTGAGMFSVPDLTGRIVAGKEASSTRLTTAVSGINSTALGAAGGSQSQVLAQGNMPVTGPTWTSGIATLPVWNGQTGNTEASGGGSNFHPVFASDLTNTSMTGTVSGGSATPLPTVQPTIILNYIIFTGV